MLTIATRRPRAATTTTVGRSPAGTGGQSEPPQQITPSTSTATAFLAKTLLVLATACGPLLVTAEASAACNTRACEERVVLKIKAAIVRPWSAKLDRVAWCESRGRWWLATGNGFFGGLQFTIQSWLAVGGRGMPNAASVLEQKYRGVRLIAVQGMRAWPNCGGA